MNSCRFKRDSTGIRGRFEDGNGGKPWAYVFIPHEAITENMTLGGLVSQFATTPDLDAGGEAG